MGDQKKAVLYLKELIDSGLDAKNFLNDILEILYLFSRRINLGPIEKEMMISESEIQLIDEYTKNLDMSDLGLFWQLTIKTIDDLKIVVNENLTLEMYIMQLVHLKNLDLKHDENITTYEQKKVLSTNKIENEKLQEGADKNKIISSIKKQMKNTDQIKENIIKSPELKKNNIDKFQIKSFNDIIQLANKEKEVELKYDLERNVKLVSFNRG